MEESEKRRERLKAMRMEAACTEGEAENTTGVSSVHGLANPLLVEDQTAQPEISNLRPRFDYYTDPMAAYSSDKRMNNHIPQAVSQPDFRPPRLAFSNVSGYRSQGSYVPNQRPSRPYVPAYHHHAFSPPPGGSPMHYRGPPPPENNPNVWSSSTGGIPSSNFPPNPVRFNNVPNHGSGGPGYGYGRGKVSSLLPDSARVPYQNQDSGRGCKGGRWQGSNAAARGRECRYYNKSMIEDPWKELQPTIWKKMAVNSSQGLSWLPNSISSTKKARVSEGPVVMLKPEQSLAEYLAASFGDAVDEGRVNEESGA
ncbi:unnamed protein product [Cuscuta epithymum]|uniref:Hydroxyproline-rich glycoprotein family protein n=1 Tax=Cuscuta epithymum TaxID=186058 RepID=A0AAV0C3C8_9ASTE|nr:unnamed protein product [Cuscuta epithymum]